MAHHGDSKATFSDHLYDLCQSGESVSSLLASEPTLAPGDAWHKLYGHHVSKPKSSHEADDAGKNEVSKEDLERAAKCGKWGPTQPSELFLRLYHDALCSIDDNPAKAMVSPSLMGSCGTVPLTIISTVPDIVKHMANLIARAEREVFLATNYWQDSVASKYITDAMRELNKRAGERGTKVVMKVIYDRGSPKQLYKPHYIVSEKEYTGKNVVMPSVEDIPNVDLQVMNYHQPLLGTFHAKYMVVDRKIAIVQSNNIQDNDNVEMMVQLEGPIVDSFYDMALISWHMKLEPPLPSHNTPAVRGGLGTFGKNHEAVIHQGEMVPRELHGYEKGEVKEPGAVDPSHGPQQSSDLERVDVVTGPSTTSSTTHPHPALPASANNNVNAADDVDGVDGVNGANGANGDNVNGASAASNSHHVNGGQPDNPQMPPQNNPGDMDPQTREYFYSGRQAVPAAQIQKPAPDGAVLPEFTADDPHFDDDTAGEVARIQTAVSGKPGRETRMEAVTRLLNHTVSAGFKGDAPECAPGEEMTPYIPHPTHEPFPMAMVNRSPYGAPNHKSVLQPQNVVWLSALRNAQKSVFIQSPTLNAEPLIPAIREACERGVDVFCYVCLGYNDAGELLPKQGGTNEMVAHSLYASLSPTGRSHLHYFWYVGKDQTAPIVQSRKRRSCHVKLMIVDRRIGIVGNGNQDTQSWFHSQEANVMLESEEVCAGWIDGLRRNQNTHLYGALSKEEGVWRDKGGKEAEGVIGVDPGRFAWARGVVGAVKRVQGTGGF